MPQEINKFSVCKVFSYVHDTAYNQNKSIKLQNKSHESFINEINPVILAQIFISIPN